MQGNLVINIYICRSDVIIEHACRFMIEGNDCMSLILLEQLKPQIAEQLQDIIDLRDSL